MTKTKESANLTRDLPEDEKKLTWKLKTLPTVQDVQELHETGLITKEEARKLLFKEEIAPSQADEISALREQVKLLVDAVQQLKTKGNVVTVPYIVEVPRRQRPYWEPIWMNTHTTTTSNASHDWQGRAIASDSSVLSISL